MLKPEVAQRLELTEEQVAKVRELVSSRMKAVVGLSQQLRETPPAEQKKMRAEFNAESERLGAEILNEAQRAKLQQVRTEWLGMLSLEEEPVAKALNLADWQKEIVAQWASKVRDNRRGPAAQKTRDEAERAIRKEISESQWVAWQAQIGKIPLASAGNPMPPDRNAPAPAAGATAQQATEPSKNADLPIDDVRLEINFQGEPWRTC